MSIRKVLIVLQTLLTAIALVVSAPGARAADDPAASLATNLVNISDFSDEFAFVDLMRGGRDWIPGRTGCFDCRTPGDPVNPACVEPNVCPVTLPLDADGYVTALDAGIGQIARTVIYAGFNTPGRLPTGRYTLLFDGAGNMTIDGASNVNTQAGRIEFDLNDTAQNITINILSTALGNHIRNMRVLPPGGVCSGDKRRFCNASTPCGTAGTCQLFTDPGVAAAQLFHPNFLANTEPYRLIRFMDWMETNSSPIQEFADYPTLTSAFWHRVPTEVMAELGNRLSSDIWVNIPHLASDAFIDEFATRLRDNFRADRKIFIEYSNENWNGIFTQNLQIPRRFCPGFPDLIDDCLQDRIPENDIPCETDPGNGFFDLPQPAASACFQALLRAWGDRSVEIFDRFDAVFGASARDRLVRVVAAQAANADLGRQVLVRNVTNTTTQVASKTDAFAVAPYFGTEYCTPSNGVNPGNNPAVYANLDAFMADMQSRAIPTAVGFMTGNRNMLQSNFGGLGIRMIAYEGGQHLAGIGEFQGNATCNSIFDAANADARMGALYTSYLDAWKDNGDEFAHFYNVGRWGRFGRWGALEFQDQDPGSSPKFMSIMGFIDDNPCWWPDCIQDGSKPPPVQAIFANGFEGTGAPPLCSPVQLLDDPGLEATTVDGGVGSNPFWASNSTNFGSVFCSADNCPTDGGTVPRSGNFFAWFGGINAAETSSLAQTVTIPAGSDRHLNFFMKRVVSNEPFNAELRIKVNGATQRTFVEQAASDPDYVARTVDLSAFANGGAHTIEFEYVNPAGSDRSDFLVDDITLECTPTGD